ncbi:hypothetical protein RRG08_026793 [Elysia crispata]|uniref:Uncharacterized protein n=1 Tax=Elysia crispata TaxID=231223 RepID=A0AAE1AQK9_9GAST|nr:hypothetical protein RRG08_026793 [Elysia crispata]
MIHSRASCCCPVHWWVPGEGQNGPSDHLRLYHPITFGGAANQPTKQQPIAPARTGLTADGSHLLPLKSRTSKEHISLEYEYSHLLPLKSILV